MSPENLDSPAPPSFRTKPWSCLRGFSSNPKSTKLEASILGREQCLLGKEFHGYGHLLSPQRGQLKQRWLLGLTGRRASKVKREENGVLKIGGNGKFSTLAHVKSHIWGDLYHGLKQIVPWGKRK